MSRLSLVSSSPISLQEARIVAGLLRVVACDLLLPHALPEPEERAATLSWLARQMVMLLEDLQSELDAEKPKLPKTGNA